MIHSNDDLAKLSAGPVDDVTSTGGDVKWQDGFGEGSKVDSAPRRNEVLTTIGGRSEEEMFICQLAVSLHQYGTASHELEDVLSACAQQLNLQAAFFSTPTAIFISFPQSRENRTVLRRLSPGEIDLEKLSAVHQLVSRFLDLQCSVESARIELEAITEAKHSFSNWLYLVGFGIASGAVVSFFGGGHREILVTACIGLLIGGLELVARSHQDFGRAFSAVAAIMASFTAVAVSRLMPGLNSDVVTLGSLIVLIPGLTVTMAINELSHQHLASGTSRLMGAMLQFLILAFGVAFGRSLGNHFFETIPPLSHPVHGLVFWACLFIAPVTFAILFRTRKEDVALVVVTCLIGYFLGKFGSSWMGTEIGPALGSFGVALFSNIVSRLYHQPPALTLVPGLMFMVPGSVGFQSLQALVQHDTLNGMQSAFTVLFVAAALVSGLLLANVLVQPRKWGKVRESLRTP